MKLKQSILCLILFAIGLFGAEQEKFSLTVGALKVIDLPFAMESYRLSTKGKVTIEEVNKQQLRVIGKEIGECNLTVTGAGVSIDYSISVKGNIEKTLKRLRTDLENLPELDMSINQDYIVIKGTVSNPSNWAHLQKVLALYKDNVHNFATFRPTAETFLNLKKILKEAGFEFAEDGQAPSQGQLEMKLTADAFILNGELWSEESIAKVNQILSTQTWLTTDPKAATPESGKFLGIIGLSVVQTVLEVDVVYVGVSEGEAEKAGSNAPTANFGLQWIYDAVAGRKNPGSSVTFGANIQNTLTFLANNGITRHYDAGHVSFVNHDSKGGELHTGGTVSVKVSGVENGSLQDIDYGLTMKIKGGLVASNKVKLDLDLTNTSAISSSGDAYTRSTDSTKQTVYCDLDKTLAVAGSQKIAQDVQKSGLPILRSTPVLKWFVSTDGGSKSETRLLILVCPRVAGATPDAQIEVPITEQTQGTYKEAKGDLKADEEAKEAAKPWYKRWFGF
ncbi:MAG: hypothetical protein J6X55_07640 [Victivallales bacterium]|nr:hypothetical protein [Victivallales bacterium]